MRTTQRKGDTALTQAIATFTRDGNDVSIPVTESARYDLVVDTLFGLKRVQVKFTTRKQVGVRSIHSNSKGYVVKYAEDNDYDWLYVLWLQENGKYEEHIIPYCLSRRNSINLTHESKYTVGLARQLGLDRD